MDKINIRLILIHFIATWFFMFAFQSLLAMHEMPMITLYREADLNRIVYEMDAAGFTASVYVNYQFWVNVGKTVGLLPAFIISAFIARRLGYSWLNAGLVIILAYGLAWTPLLGLHLLSTIYYTRFLVFIPIDLLLVILFCMFFLFGVLFFTSPRTTRFIQGNKKVNAV